VPMNEPERKKRAFEYKETMRVLARQSAVLDGLRNRAYILLTANSIVAAVFASAAFENSKAQHHLALAILALVVFALGIMCCIGTIWSVHDAGAVVDPRTWSDYPRWPSGDRPRRWRVTFQLKELTDFHERLDDQDAKKTVTDFELARKTNWATINRRTNFLEAACVLMPIQIALWAVLALMAAPQPASG
jgi:hypothetical protein